MFPFLLLQRVGPVPTLAVLYTKLKSYSIYSTRAISCPSSYINKMSQSEVDAGYDFVIR